MTARPDIEGFLALAGKTSSGPWDGPHLSDDNTTCNCASIVNGGYAGAIAYVCVDNGIASIGDGSNDCPPLDEAKANGLLLAAAKNTAPAIAEYALALEEENKRRKATIDRVSERVAVFADMGPEDGESWASWYSAAFDLLAAEISALSKSQEMTAPDQLSRLESEKNDLENLFGMGAHHDGVVRDRIAAVDAKISDLKKAEG